MASPGNSGLAAAMATAVPPTAIDLDNREEVAQLAYSYWLARGCPDGSPEDDWLRAEQDILRQRNQPAELATWTRPSETGREFSESSAAGCLNRT
jgi:hypothetical protein